MTQLTLNPQLPLRALNPPIDDLISSLLAEKHKETTRNTYRLNLKYFAFYLLGGEIRMGCRISLSDTEVKSVLMQFLNLSAKKAIAYFGNYQSLLIEAGYTPNTINIRLASVKALVKYAYKFELCLFILDDVKILTPEVYRDTNGISKDSYSKILKLPDTNTISGKRDYAILRLLWDNALRRSEISNLNIGDFNPAESTLKIKGKGNYTKEVVHLAPKTIQALNDWLKVRIWQNEPNQPLFTSLATNTNGHRITGKSIYCLVRKYSDEVLEDKILSPHRVRHSSITAVLDASNGNVRMAQKLSRHKNLDVLTRYDDNRVALQKEAVNLLSELV
jgi:integrase/recombinase XerC